MTDELPTQQILAYLSQQKQDMIYFLRWLVLAESPTLAPESQQKAFALLGDKLRELDYAVRLMPGRTSGGILFARPHQRERCRPLQLLLGHCDTVWPLGALDEMPVQINDNVMMGPGVYDMKSGLTQILYALQTLQALDLKPPVTPVVLINSDEETGSIDSTPYIRLLARIANRAFVLEPALGPSGKLKTARKGVVRFNVVIKGKAAHAGVAPHEGVSAILELSHVIQKLFDLNDPQRGVTVNVGAVDGGLRPNVIAPESRALVDVRAPTLEDSRRITEAIFNIRPVTTGTTVEMQLMESSPPMERTPRNQALWQVARRLGRKLGLELEETTSGGGSDGNTTSQFTATLDGLGPIGDGAHARHEYINLDSLVERCALLTLLLMAPPI